MTAEPDADARSDLRSGAPADPPLHEAGVADLQAAFAAGSLTAERLVGHFLARIETLDRGETGLHAVLEVNPDAEAIARALDQERAERGPRGPLHGIPVLLKDNVATADRLHTSAGSRALAESIAPRDAFLVAGLRAAGAVILGKASMTEWANYMSTDMPAGYSSRGGQVVNPYGRKLTPGGSSSGSAVAVAAGLATLAVGTETSGSILSPATWNAVVGIKPTVGLVSRSGIVPIAASQDTAGPMARTVADAALLLSAMLGVDPADRATRASRARVGAADLLALDAGALRGARLGVPRAVYWDGLGAGELPVLEAALRSMRDAGAVLVDPADVPTARAVADFRSDVMLYEFKRDLNRYLAGLGPGAPIRSLRDLIRYNEARPAEMLRYGQVRLLAAQATSGLRARTYAYGRAQDLRLSRTEGLDATLARDRLDALVFPHRAGAAIGARAGYPAFLCRPASPPMAPRSASPSWAPPGPSPSWSAWPTPSSKPPTTAARPPDGPGVHISTIRLRPPPAAAQEGRWRELKA